MNCPNCNKPTSPDGTFCARCSFFVSNPKIGKKAGLLKRWLASLIDYVPIAIVMGLWVTEMAYQSSYFSVVTVGVGVAILSYLVFLLWLWSDGVSPVKRLLGLEVVSKLDGSYVGFWKMVQREVVGKSLSGLVFGLGFLWAIWDKDGQTWHDKMAGTVVVQRRQRQPAAAADARKASAEQQAEAMTHMAYHCPSCQQVLRQQVRFCPNCKQSVRFAPRHQGLAPAASAPAASAPAASAPPAPPSVDQLLQDGIAQIQRGDLAAGQATLRRVVIHAPNNATAWLWMGWVAIGQRDQHIAEVCFTQAHRLGHPKASAILTALRQDQSEPVSAGFVAPDVR